MNKTTFERKSFRSDARRLSIVCTDCSLQRCRRDRQFRRCSYPAGPTRQWNEPNADKSAGQKIVEPRGSREEPLWIVDDADHQNVAATSVKRSGRSVSKKNFGTALTTYGSTANRGLSSHTLSYTRTTKSAPGRTSSRTRQRSRCLRGSTTPLVGRDAWIWTAVVRNGVESSVGIGYAVADKQQPSLCGKNLASRTRMSAENGAARFTVERACHDLRESRKTSLCALVAIARLRQLQCLLYSPRVR